MATARNPYRAWDLTHDPYARPLGCNGRYGKSGVNKHYYDKTEPCEACRVSSRHYEKEVRRGQHHPRPKPACGSNAAAQRHRRRGEVPLDFECAVAEANARRERYARRKARVSVIA